MKTNSCRMRITTSHGKSRFRPSEEVVEDHYFCWFLLIEGTLVNICCKKTWLSHCWTWWNVLQPGFLRGSTCFFFRKETSETTQALFGPFAADQRCLGPTGGTSLRQLGALRGLWKITGAVCCPEGSMLDYVMFWWLWVLVLLFWKNIYFLLLFIWWQCHILVIRPPIFNGWVPRFLNQQLGNSFPGIFIFSFLKCVS